MPDQLLTVPLIAPGFSGLNKSQATATNLSPEWAVELQNIVFDASNRIAARQGWTKTSATNITGSPVVQQTASFVKADGTTLMVSAANNKLYSGLSSFTDITGALTPTANNWQFINYYDKVLGWQTGHTPITWSGSGNFAAMTAASGALPTGNCACAAFGRVWAVDSDGFTIKYCGLGDETNWGGAGSGSINMRQLWTHGTDTVIGIYAVGAKLAVFGSRHIISFIDGTGSNIGLNPSTMVVSDTIEGTGLVGRDTVQPYTTGDVLYLSPHGVQSFARTIIQKSNPVYSLDTQVRDYMRNYIGSETNATLKSVFSPNDRFYLLVLPNSTRIFCYDTLYPTSDGRLRVAEWIYAAANTPNCATLDVSSNKLYFGVTGNLGWYNGYNDNGTSYRYVFHSPFTTGTQMLNPMQMMGTPIETRIKVLKRLTYAVFATVTTTAVVKWGYDFSGFGFSTNVTLQGGKIPEYGTAEYGTNGVYSIADPTAVPGVDYSQYGGSADLKLGRVPGTSAGRWFQLGIEADISTGAFALQQFDATVKIGRMG